jgi:hypothetical protein
MTEIAIQIANRASRCATVAGLVSALVTAAPARTVVAQGTGALTSSVVADDSSNRNGEEEEKTTAGGPSFLPIPIFITEPAIGVGFGAVLAHFHKKPGGTGGEASIPRAMTSHTPTETGRQRKPPPTITGVAAAYTDNGTWAAGIGHSASWKKDTVRYSGAIAYADVKSAVYLAGIPFNFDIKGGILLQDIKFRLGKSNFFLGGKLSALAATSKIEFGSKRPIELDEGDRTNIGLAVQAIFETRDNVVTPNHGQLIQLDLWRYDDAIGGDFDYWSATFKVNSFHQLADRFVLGWRIDARAVDGRPPFWGYPWVSLRGIPALRYQQKRVGVVEMECRYNLANRWGVVGFFGTGVTDGDISIFEPKHDIYAGGIGGRFLFKQDENLWVGIDIARGPEDMYWYIQVGQAW